MRDNEVKYVRLDGNEGILAKRYFLSTEMILLKILRGIKGYHNARVKELKEKTKLLNSLREINQNVRKIQNNIPKLTTSKLESEWEKPENIKTGRMKTGESAEDRNLEMQLRDIQEKLRALQR
jgi:hypothetical protein